MRKLTLLSPVLALFIGFAGLAHGQAQPFGCSVNVAVPPIVRAEGLDELVGDLTMYCNGGTPTPAGQPLPQFNFTLLLSTNFTSKLTAGNQFTEALLTVDEPASANNPSRPLLNCGNNGAPDNGTPGPGVCSIVSTGSPASNYDGTSNGYAAAACDGAGGRPAANSYGCGRPNVFQGRLGTPQSLGQLNAVTFFNVPVDPPGAGVTRTFRFTNLRVNAVSVGVSSTNESTVAQATVTATGPISMTISNPQQAVAFVQQGLATGPTSCSGPGPLVCVQEGFASSWRPKNISFAVGNGIPGNANLPPSQSYWVYAGGTNYPPDAAQNVPGAIYNTETGFEWLNNSPNGPPSPNPPNGVGTVNVLQGLPGPLNSSGFGGLNTGINAAGVANSGTRIAIKFTGVPPGASVQVPAVITLTTQTSTPSGVMVLTTTDAAGAGPYTPQTGTVTVTNNLAVYEVLWASPFAIETAAVPYTVVNGSPSGVQATASFAPFYSDGGSQQASATDPVPRFLDSSQLCADQSCLNVNPSQGVNSGPIQLSITNSGGQSLTGAQAVLRAAGVPDIPGTNASNPASNQLSARFDLTNAPIGARDLVLTPAGQNPMTLAGGFSVLGAPACAYSAGPESASFPSTGGSGSLVVTATPASCAWTATTSATWITLLPVSPGLPLVQPYTVATNPGTPRSVTITIAGTLVTVTQAGASSCSYGISPGGNLFGASGGNLTINVTAGSGCSWSAASNASWVTFPGSSSGSGNGAVAISVSSNSVGFRSATVTIAGQTFSATQSGPPCGGRDVSSQVQVTRRALLNQWGFRTAYTQQLQITNTGASVAGPVYVVIYGFCGPSTQAWCPGGYTLVQCQGFTAPNFANPAVPIAPNGLAAGETLVYDLQFGTGTNPYQNPVVPTSPNSVPISVVSGTPGVQ